MNDTEQLMQALREEYDALDGDGEIAVSPALVAARTLQRLDRDGDSPTLVALAATLELRQLARAICRQASNLDDPSDQPGQGALFDGQLQRRYPAQRSGAEVYVLREHLTLDERRSNIARLRAEAASKMRHADALESETEGLVARGVLGCAAA